MSRTVQRARSERERFSTVRSSRVVHLQIALGVGLVIVVGVVAGALLFPRAGQFIVAEDHFTYAEAALILSGDPIRRALAARDLYRQGRIGQILVIPDPSGSAEEELMKLGLVPPSSLAERILVKSGVPRSKITFLPEPADGTIVEAQRVRRFLEDRYPQRLAVITSKFASRRACFIFRRVLSNVEILCSPTPYDPFSSDRWWATPRNALTVLMEYQKFLANAVTLTLGFQGD